MEFCGWCSIIRRSLRSGSRRESTNSFYKQLGDEETMEFGEKGENIEESEMGAARSALLRRKGNKGAEPSMSGTPATKALPGDQVPDVFSPDNVEPGDQVVTSCPCRAGGLKEDAVSIPGPTEEDQPEDEESSDSKSSDIDIMQAEDQPATSRVINIVRPEDQPSTSRGFNIVRPEDQPSTSRGFNIVRPENQPSTSRGFNIVRPEDQPSTSRGFNIVRPEDQPSTSRGFNIVRPEDQPSTSRAINSVLYEELPSTSRGIDSVRLEDRRSSSSSSIYSFVRSWDETSPVPFKFLWKRGDRTYREQMMEYVTPEIDEEEKTLLNLVMEDRRPLGNFLTLQHRNRRRKTQDGPCPDVGIIDDLLNRHAEYLLKNSHHWNFDTLLLDRFTGGRSLPEISLFLFEFYGLIDYFELDVMKLLKFFLLIENGYVDSNPYHNSVHAADVTQAMHCFLTQHRINRGMNRLEILAAITAAIAHDYDHPGVNQHFLTQTSHHLSNMYSNKSVLENHHWRAARSCIIQSGVFDHVNCVQAMVVRQMKSLILATDISHQSDYLGRFIMHTHSGILDMSKYEHRNLVLQIALKSADISNPCRPWEISRKWSLKVCDEFFRQGDKERALNLPVSIVCDRFNNNISRIQTGFLRHVVSPLVKEFHLYTRSIVTKSMLRNLNGNVIEWQLRQVDDSNEITDEELVDKNLLTPLGTSMSESSALLSPLRRASLNPVTKSESKKQPPRRFSEPDTKHKSVYPVFRSSTAEPPCPSSPKKETRKSSGQEEMGAIKLLLQRTGPHDWVQRRGSAPAPLAQSVMSLEAIAAGPSTSEYRPGIFPGCLLNPSRACHSQDESIPQTPRKSSLPVEVFKYKLEEDDDDDDEIY